MSTIIVHANVHPIGYIYQDHPNTKCLPKDKMKKGKVKITLTLAKSKRQALRKGKQGFAEVPELDFKIEMKIILRGMISLST